MKEINAMRKKTEVLIVGAGPVGQALTIELGQRGVHCLIVEKNARAGAAPRAKTINVRTCEHFRRWGISNAPRAAAPLGIDYPSNIAFTTRMSGHLLARFDNALYCAPGRNPLYSEHAQWTPQYTVEKVMREHLQTMANVQVAMNMELLGFKQTDDRIVATILDAESGAEREVDAQYLVGCDGARSLVRDLIGARLEGSFGMNMGVLKEASANHSKVGAALFEEGLEDDTPEWQAARARVSHRINAEKLSEFYTLGTILGDRYSDSPVVQRVAGTRHKPRDFLTYVPSSMPGARAPHLWLHDGSSLFDHFGSGFTLLALPTAAEAFIQAAVRDAKLRGVPLTVLRSDNPGASCLYDHGLSLIRPDQHIAWVGNTWPQREEFDVFAMVTGQAAKTIPNETLLKETVHEPSS